MPAAAASSTRQRRLMTPLRIRYTQHRVRRMPPNSRGAAAARQGQGQGQHGGGGQVPPVPQAQVKGHGQGRQQHGGGKVAVGQVQHAADVSLSQPGLAIGQQHRQGHAQAQGAENLRKPAVQVIGPLFRQVRAEQHIQHQHPHAQAQGIVQGQRLHGLLAGDHAAAPQQSGDGHQRQAQAAAADPQGHRPDGEVPQKGHQQRRHQRRAGQKNPSAAHSTGRT